MTVLPSQVTHRLGTSFIFCEVSSCLAHFDDARTIREYCLLTKTDPGNTFFSAVSLGHFCNFCKALYRGKRWAYLTLGGTQPLKRPSESQTLKKVM